ncbi:hypothetical protein GGG16DRAFT_96472 [Schizophyllum commune]
MSHAWHWVARRRVRLTASPCPRYPASRTDNGTVISAGGSASSPRVNRRRRPHRGTSTNRLVADNNLEPSARAARIAAGPAAHQPRVSESHAPSPSAEGSRTAPCLRQQTGYAPARLSTHPTIARRIPHRSEPSSNTLIARLRKRTPCEQRGSLPSVLAPRDRQDLSSEARGVGQFLSILTYVEGTYPASHPSPGWRDLLRCAGGTAVESWRAWGPAAPTSRIDPAQ